MDIVKFKNLDELKLVSEKIREFLLEKFQETNHKKWAPVYLASGTMALSYWYTKRQWRL